MYFIKPLKYSVLTAVALNCYFGSAAISAALSNEELEGIKKFLSVLEKSHSAYLRCSLIDLHDNSKITF